MKTYDVEVNFWAVGYKIKAKTAAEAKKKAKAKVKAGIAVSNINSIYVDEIQ